MASSSRSERSHRIDVLMRIFSERTARMALASLPGVGGAVDHLVFGVRESLAFEELRSQVMELAGQVRTLADARVDAAAAARLETFLNELDDGSYEEAEKLLLLMIETEGAVEAGPLGLKETLDLVVEADLALARTIEDLRDTERLLLRSLSTTAFLREFLSAVGSARLALDMAESGQKPILYLEASVLSDYFFVGRGSSGTLGSAVSQFLVRNAAPNALRIAASQLVDLRHMLSASLRLSDGAVGAGNTGGYATAARIAEFFDLPQDWNPRRGPLSVKEVVERTKAAQGFFAWLSGIRPDGRRASERLMRLSHALAELAGHAEQSDGSDVAVLVAREDVLRWIERAAITMPGCHITHAYGPAFHAFLARENRVTGARARRQVAQSISRIQDTVPADLLGEFESSSRTGWADEVRRHLPEFFRAADDFHQAIAQELDRFRLEFVSIGIGWTDRLVDGSELFNELLAWMDSLAETSPEPRAPL